MADNERCGTVVQRSDPCSSVRSAVLAVHGHCMCIVRSAVPLVRECAYKVPRLMVNLMAMHSVAEKAHRMFFHFESIGAFRSEI